MVPRRHRGGRPGFSADDVEAETRENAKGTNAKALHQARESGARKKKTNVSRKRGRRKKRRALF